MKTIAAMLTLGVACWAFGTQAQTFDTRLLSQYDASVLRELYPVCRHTTVSAEQQVRLAERIRQENLRFAELIRCDGGVLAPASETELERMRDNALREILTEEQLLQYYRYAALPAAYARGREAKKIVSKQLQLPYKELKYVNNAFFVIEQETQAAKKFWRGNPAEARDRIRSVYEREIAQLEAKSGIRIDKQMRAVRVVELTDYAPLMPAGK